ncbi:hypothetical protein [Nodosilinea sp. FACHB-13]|uniref:hypothetical protein n=1 Tax=Cyanophyceae TaxID=3028117 RepID=UPI001686CCC5|nr:hypothetical protein [Nodosilinea sp. FACHB-13]MBD2107505.1 hypothetical protein [Nodosilinea sp. FACHB-13]
MAIARWSIGLLLGVLLWLGLGHCAKAQSEARIDMRLSSLESELGRLRSQVRQIESQLSIPNRPAPSLPTITSPGVEPSLDEQFDNLATLAIELKQQVRQLETRVTQLERAGS